jgi:hypothetical protein
MESFNAAVATAFDLEPHEVSAVTTDFIVEELENPDRSTTSADIYSTVFCALSPDLEWTRP